jgi:DNA-binding response OmpR family regulator
VDEPSLLVVEDDAELCDVLARGLREEGFAVEGVATVSVLPRRPAECPDGLPGVGYATR